MHRPIVNPNSNEQELHVYHDSSAVECDKAKDVWLSHLEHHGDIHWQGDAAVLGTPGTERLRFTDVGNGGYTLNRRQRDVSAAERLERRRRRVVVL